MEYILHHPVPDCMLHEGSGVLAFCPGNIPQLLTEPDSLLKGLLAPSSLSYSLDLFLISDFSFLIHDFHFYQFWACSGQTGRSLLSKLVFNTLGC